MMPKVTKAQIHPTNRCNLNCIFCDVPFRYKGKPDLPDEKWISTVKELCELGPEIVTISGGGEPFVRTKLLIDIIKMLHSAGIKIEVISNGTFISDDVTKTIAECCHHYRVSLHSTTIESDEFLRGVKGSVKLSFEGIKKIAEWKKKLNKNKPTIDIAMVLTKINISEIEKMIIKASEFGANRISLRIVHKWGEKYRPTQEQMKYLKKKLKEYEEMAKKRNLDLIYDFVIEDMFEPAGKKMDEILGDKNNKLQKDEPFCTLPFREIVVFADGRVACCCNFIIDPEESEGVDSIKNRTLHQVWMGEKFKNL